VLQEFGGVGVCVFGGLMGVWVFVAWWFGWFGGLIVWWFVFSSLVDWLLGGLVFAHVCDCMCMFVG